MEDLFRFDPVNEDDLFNVAALIEHTGQALKLARERELSQYGISSRNAAALLVVWALDNYATPTDISRWLLREPHSITELLARMERDGYIRRFQDRERRNVVRVAMTEKGREAYFRSLRRESYHEIMSVLADDEREELRRLLAKVWKAALSAAGTDIAWAKRASSHLTSSNHAGMQSSPKDGNAEASE
jgi:DNA-binding MarR family transcriptional regulator